MRGIFGNNLPEEADRRKACFPGWPTLSLLVLLGIRVVAVELKNRSKTALLSTLRIMRKLVLASSNTTRERVLRSRSFILLQYDSKPDLQAFLCVELYTLDVIARERHAHSAIAFRGAPTGAIAHL